MEIGERIRQRRVELNMTQDELAKKVGYKSRSSIQKIESARTLPLKKVSLVAKALDCSPSSLMGWTDVDIVAREVTGQEEVPAHIRKYIEYLLSDNALKLYIDKLRALPDEYRRIVYNTIDSVTVAYEQVKDIGK